MSPENGSPDPKTPERSSSPITEAPTRQAEQPAIRSAESVLTPDKVGDIREFAVSAADGWQAERRVAFGEKDADAVDHARDMEIAMHHISKGEAISPPEGPLTLEPYQALARAYQRDHPPFSEAEYDAAARDGVSAKLIEMELADLQTDTFGDRIDLYAATKEGAAVTAEAAKQDAKIRREMAEGHVRHDLQLSAELEHLQKGGAIADTPLAAERLQQRIDEARERQKQAEVRAARRGVEQAQAPRPERERPGSVEMPTDDASRAAFAEKYFGNLELERVLDPDVIDKFGIYIDSMMDVFAKKHARVPSPETTRYPGTVGGVLGNRGGPEMIYLINAMNMRLGERKFAELREIGGMPLAEVLKDNFGIDVVEAHPDYYKIFS